MLSLKGLSAVGSCSFWPLGAFESNHYCKLEICFILSDLSQDSICYQPLIHYAGY